MDNMERLHIEESSHEKHFVTMCVEGLSVSEMNEIIDMDSFEEKCDALCRVMGKHENDSKIGRNIANVWYRGNGIYSIRHVGGHLFVRIGKNC